MSPRLLWVIGLALLVLGLALPIAAISKNGAPWGYRGHRGVFVEAAGDVQVTDVEGNRKDATGGAWLEVGDELRASRFSIARANLPEGVFAVSDSGMVRITAKGILFTTGAIDVTVPAGTGKLLVEIEGFESALTVRPAASAAQVRVIADGKGAAFAHVRAGSLDAGGTGVESGQVLTLRRGQAPKASPAPSSVELAATCDGAKVTVTATAGAQVFVPGFARVSDGSPIVIDAPAGASRVIASARDVAGNIARPQEVACVKPELAPEPPAPKPTPKVTPKVTPKPAPKTAPKPIAPKPAPAKT